MTNSVSVVIATVMLITNAFQDPHAVTVYIDGQVNSSTPVRPLTPVVIESRMPPTVFSTNGFYYVEYILNQKSDPLIRSDEVQHLGVNPNSVILKKGTAAPIVESKPSPVPPPVTP